MEVLHFVSHRVPGGAVAIADRLALGLSSPARVVSLGLEPGHSPRAAARALFRVAIVLIRERPRAVISHMPRCAFLVAAVAFVCRVPQRMAVQHAPATELSPMTVAMDSWFSRTGVFTDVVFVGDAVRDTFPSFDRVKARRCVIRNGTDPVPEELTRASSSSRSSTVSVVSVGALIPRKNLDLLVRACARAKAVTRLVIVGDGPERRAIADLAGALGVNLVLVGQIPAREVLPETRRHTVFAFPSRAEALPLALIEAAKAGMPILASDIEPNQEVVGSAALFRGVDDVEGWAEALDELVGDVNLRERLGKAAVLRTQGFGASQMLAAYEQVLRAR